MNANTLLIILNCVFGGLVFFGFLFGLKGIKKSTYSLVVFILSLVVVFLLCNTISGLVLNIKINGETLHNTIGNAINDLVGADSSSSDLLKDVMSKLPLMVVNIVVFPLLVIIVGLIFKIIGAIIYAIFFKKNDKGKKVEKCEIVDGAPQMQTITIKKKKYRWFGGLVGAVHGFLFSIILVLPIFGLVNIVSDVTKAGTVNAETITYGDGGEAGESTFELKKLSEVLSENLPKEFYEYTNALNNSIFGRISKIGNISEVSLNMVARCKINGKNIKLGKEIRNIVDSYDSFVDFATQNGLSNGEEVFENIVNNPEDYDFDDLYTLIDKLFSSDLINAISGDALKIAVNELEKSAKNQDEQILYYHIKTATYSYVDSGYKLKNDIKELLGVVEILVKNEILSEITSEKFDVDVFLNKLFNEETETLKKNELINEIATKLTNSNLFQKALIESYNYGINQLGEVLVDNVAFEINNLEFDVLDSKSNIKLTSTQLYDLAVNGKEIYDLTKDLKISEVTDVFNYDLSNIIRLSADEVNCVFNLEHVKEAGLIEDLAYYFGKSEYKEYASFEYINSKNIKQYLNNVADSVEVIESSDLVKNINAFNNNELKEYEFINALALELSKVAEGENKTLVEKIVQPLLNTKPLKNTLIYGLDYLQEFLADFVNNAYEPDIEVSPLNTSNVFTTESNNEIIGILKALAIALKDIDFTRFENEDVEKVLLSCDLKNVGIAFDLIKESKLFGKVGSKQGMYSDLIDSLEYSVLSDYIDFGSAKNDDFSWEEELSTLSTTITNLNENIVIEGKGLVDYILDGGNLENLLDTINEDDVINLKPLFENKLIKPLALTVINEINNAILEFVGSEIGTNIKEFNKSDNIDLTTQSQEIINVIKKLIAIDFNSLDFDNLTDQQIEDINSLLEVMQVNAKNNGVFKDSFNALCIKMSTIIVDAVVNYVDEELQKGIDSELISFGITGQTNIIEDSDEILTLTYTLLINFNKLKDMDSFKDLNLDALFAILDSFNNNATILNGYLLQPYNALLVDIINDFNGEIKNLLSNQFKDNITTYSLSEKMYEQYAFIKFILQETFDLVSEENLDFTTLNISDLNNLLNILNLCNYTKETSKSILSYISNEIIVSVNEFTGYNATELSQTKDLITQKDNIINTLDELNEIKKLLDENNLQFEDLEVSQIEGLLNVLETSYNSNGVFAQTYNYILVYISNQIITNVNDLINANNSLILTTENVTSQKSQILDILSELNNSKDTITNKGAKISDLTNDEKNGLVTLLEKVKNNALTDGVFDNTYNSLVEYVAEENSIPTEIIIQTYGSYTQIDWEEFVNNIN